MNNLNELFPDLEPDAHVPAHLQKVLLSEIDFIRDSMQVVALFTSVFLDTALLSVVPLEEK
ncbi:hypothetical protein GCM10027275_28520 [Rhabdobacter roseus]|uniref:Uncharacterized protein n=1 Tax=Rhabdobacter roseus TaxID=1655419 RepID=A0A840TMG5_9BACT|nr:hypothetical protein [Rhabdobacter roseus]MBB5284801.1 hypothetical protein [Rhabdobacter roseus]